MNLFSTIFHGSISLIADASSNAKSSNHVSTKAAPIFALFIDCVWQLQQQHPAAFEFNARYLCCLLNGTGAGRFGTLLFDSLADRVAARRSAADSNVGHSALSPVWPSDSATSRNGSGSSGSNGSNGSSGSSGCDERAMRAGRAALPSLWTWLRSLGRGVRNPAFALSQPSLFAFDVKASVGPSSPSPRVVHRLAFDASAVRFWAPYHLQHARADRFASPLLQQLHHNDSRHIMHESATAFAHHDNGDDDDSCEKAGSFCHADPAERVVRAAMASAARAQVGARAAVCAAADDARMWERAWAESLCRDVLLRRWAAAAVDASSAMKRHD